MRLILFFLILSTQICLAQISFSTEYREYCDWNDSTQKFDNCRGYEESSLFTMNKAESMFTHTTDEVKSTYYIKSSEYDKQKELWTYVVNSDVGNEYICVFDPKNKVIKFVLLENKKATLLRFYIKSIF